MENEILDILEDIKYEGDLADENKLIAVVEGSNGGPRNVSYTKIIAWVSDELKVLHNLEEHVNATTSEEDHSSFSMEVAGVLKELGCSHKSLMEGPLSDRFNSKDSRLLLLLYLLEELQTARILSTSRPVGIKVEMSESPPAKALKALLIALGFPKPPSNITPKQLFSKVESKVMDVKIKAHPSLIGKPLFNESLDDKQWLMLQQMEKDMNTEYQMRRQMLIKRLDVTFQSFQWSDMAKARADDLTRAFRSKRDLMSEEPDVSLADILAARDDLAILEKTSSSSVRKNTKSNLNKVLIGKVPDRGGRAYEHEPPPPEMPSWTQRQPGGGGGGGGHRGGHFKGGGPRVQGGWNQDRRGGGGCSRKDGQYDNRRNDHADGYGSREYRRGGRRD